MHLDIKMNGLDELEKAAELAAKKADELRAAISGVNAAMMKLQLEINQPPDSVDS